MTLNLEDELVKVRDALGALWAKVPHTSETDASAIAEQIDAIGPQPEPETTEPTADDLAAELARRNAVPSKPLAEMTDEELAAEIAKRQEAAAS